MKAIRQFISQYFIDKPMIFIGLKFGIWYAIIHVLLNKILAIYPFILQNYLKEAAQFSILILNSWLGLPYETYEISIGMGVWNGDFLSVIINETCGGVPIYKLYIVLLFAFIPGIVKKIIGIISGVSILLFVNVLRIIGIILVKEFYPIYFKFAHEIVFVYLMYGLSIWIWYRIYKLPLKRKSIKI